MASKFQICICPYRWSQGLLRTHCNDAFFIDGQHTREPISDCASLGPLQQAALVLNASRRFRYTLDLRKDEEQEKRRRMIRAHAQVIRVTLEHIKHG